MDEITKPSEPEAPQAGADPAIPIDAGRKPDRPTPATIATETLATDPDKDKRARLERFAQAHLDRAQTLSSGSTKAALAWAVALALIWFQILEHRLTLVRAAQKSQNAFVTITQSGAEEIGAEHLAQRVAVSDAKLKIDESAAADQQIELPFSIKLTLPPYWVPTLWLLLALGLSVYMQDARRRIFRLTARGIRLQREAGVDDPRIRSLVGGGIWWLAPLPSSTGTSPDSDSLHEVFCWLKPVSNTVAVAGAAATLLFVQARVQYVSLCVGAGLLAGRNGSSHSTAWISITLMNLILGIVIAVMVWRWFSDPADPEAIEELESNGAGITRRRALYLAWGGVLATVAFVSNLMAMYAFAAARLGRLPSVVTKPVASLRHHMRNRRRKTRSQLKRPSLPFGLYVNPHTGTVHIWAPAPEKHQPSCTSCIESIWASRLKLIEPSRVHWNAPKPLRNRFLAVEDSAAKPDAPATSSLPAVVRRFNAALPHPHVTHRTFMVEQQAIAYLHGGDPDLAIKILLEASRAVSVFGLRTGVRLYDLLAGLAVRYHHRKALDDLNGILSEELRKVNAYSERLSVPGTRVAIRLARWLGFVLIVAGVENGSEFEAPLISRRRGHPRHHENRKVTGHPPAPAKNLTSPAVDRGKLLADSLRARIEKWSKTDNDWARHWKSTQPVMWAGVKLPGLTKR